MKTVLVVDDELTCLQNLSEGLEALSDDYRVMIAENGKQALSLISVCVPDVVLTDLRMPEMDGLELIAHLGSEFPEVPVIVMTAFGTPKIEQELRQHGIQAYLEKPLDITTVIAVLGEVLSRDRRQVERTLLITFLPLVATTKLSCRVRVSSEGRTGHFDFLKGRLVHAVVGKREGLEAAYEMIAWSRTRVLLEQTPPEHHTIDMSLDDVLLEGLSRAERAMAHPPSPAPRVAEPALPATARGAVSAANLARIREAVAALQAELGEGLAASEVFHAPSRSLVARVGSISEGVEIFGWLPDEVARDFRAQGFPAVRGMFAELAGEQLLAVLVVGEFRWGMLVDLTRVQQGYLINIVIPRTADALRSVLGQV